MAVKTHARVSEACQINDLDHASMAVKTHARVSEACQINDLDHTPLYENLII